MSFLHELKRRNVFRVGIAYGVISWVLLQAIDFSLDIIAAPNWIMQVFMLLGLVGLPLVLVFAWVFERTPEGFKRESEIDPEYTIRAQTGHKLDRVVVIFLGIAVLILLADKFINPDAVVAPDTESMIAEVSVNQPVTVKAAAAIPEERSIAVLPFVNMSSDTDQEYFSDGISEEILNVLVRLQDLKVVGRTSSFSFKGKNQDLREIGEALNVAYILEGSVRKAGERVRITAQLIQVKDGFHLWSNSFDRELTDIFAVQDEIATAIAKALAIELKLDVAGTELAPAKTHNMAAYDRYLEGRELVARRNNFPRAIELLNEAVELDPGFAAGWAVNAQAHALATYYIPGDRGLVNEQARSMALRALELDPNLSIAHSVLGDVHRDHYEWNAASASYRRALELNPDNIEANSQYAQMLWRVQYIDEALKYSNHAVSLDPLSWLNLTINSALLYLSGDTTTAWNNMRRAELISATEREYLLRHGVRMALSDGNKERALAYMHSLASAEEMQLRRPEVTEYYRALPEVLDSKEKTLQFLSANQERIIAIDFNEAGEGIFWAAYYGDFQLAEKLMVGEQAQVLDIGIVDAAWITYPVLSPLFNSAAYKNLLRQARVDKFWRENGFPENCKALGEDDFTCN